MQCNVGKTDKLLRIGAGIALLGLGASDVIGWWGLIGVVPLAIATGASSASQQAIGTGVIGGMITATLAVVFVPVFFVVVMKLVRKRS